jgi:TRAP transporter TAXI family solute receptor
MRAASIVVLAVGLAPAATAADIVIGSGGKGSIFYSVGRALCRIIATGLQDTTCQVLATEAGDATVSLANLSNVNSGAIEIGLAQSDWQFYAVKRTGPVEFMADDFGSLRALFSFHSEPFTVVARRDAGIRRFDDLKGKRVNIANPGSGERATMQKVMAAKGWSKKDFRLVEGLPVAQQSFALCNNQVQAAVYTVAHPDPAIRQLAKLCDAVIIDITGPEIDKLIASEPYFTYTAIPGGTYANNADPVRTFGVRATVVSSSDVSEAVIYDVVKAVFDNLDRIKRMHPAFGSLDPAQMLRDGMSAPLHDGAARYYRERGLM